MTKTRVVILGALLYAVGAYIGWVHSVDSYQFHIVGDMDVTSIRGSCAVGDKMTVWIAGKPGIVWTCMADEFSWMKTVVDYGADPDGVEDSTAAIQKAIDAGGDLLLPSGIYNVEGGKR